jgi:hypothetical protein
VEFLQTDQQIWAATMHDARTSLSTTAEGGGFRATAEEVHATRTKKEEMVRELLNGWQKGAHYGYIPEVKEDNIIQLGCENVNSLVSFTQPNQRCKNLLTYIKGIERTGPA